MTGLSPLANNTRTRQRRASPQALGTLRRASRGPHTCLSTILGASPTDETGFTIRLITNVTLNSYWSFMVATCRLIIMEPAVNQGTWEEERDEREEREEM